jgi:hypothetical protein
MVQGDRRLYKVADVSEENAKRLLELSGKEKGEVVEAPINSWILKKIGLEPMYVATLKEFPQYKMVLRPFWVRMIEKRAQNKVRVELQEVQSCESPFFVGIVSKKFGMKSNNEHTIVW